MKVLSIALLASYPFFVNLKGTTLSIVVDLASAAKNVLSVRVFSLQENYICNMLYALLCIPVHPYFLFTLTPVWLSLLIGGNGNGNIRVMKITPKCISITTIQYN